MAKTSQRFKVRNRERLLLIHKRFDLGLSPGERRRLSGLEWWCESYMARRYPLDLSQLETEAKRSQGLAVEINELVRRIQQDDWPEDMKQMARDIVVQEERDRERRSKLTPDELAKEMADWCERMAVVMVEAGEDSP